MFKFLELKRPMLDRNYLLAYVYFVIISFSLLLSSSISVRMMYAQRQSTIAKINSDMCAVQEVGDYEIMLRAVISTGGSYRLRCRVDQESSTTSVNQGGVKVINEESTVSRIVPSTINSCRNGSFILLVKLANVHCHLLMCI